MNKHSRSSPPLPAHSVGGGRGVSTNALLLIMFVAWVLGCNMAPVDTSQRNGGAAARPANSAEAATWSYSEEPDKMGRGVIRRASTTSTNTVSFDFPYQGEQRARLTLRTHPQHGKDVMLSVERGQFLTGVSGCRALIRFDDRKPETFWANGPEDLSTTILFIDGYEKIVPGIKRSKKVMIEAPFYQEGNRIFEFNVEGLKWDTAGQK